MKKVYYWVLLISYMLMSTNGEAESAPKPGVQKTVFGTMPDGREAYLFTLRNAAGMEVQVTNYGAYIVSCTAPDKQGKFENVTLGVPTFADYLKGTPNLGPVVGRFGNRIAKGRFTLDGQEYKLAVNNGANHLHGGLVGFDKKLWSATEANGAEPAVTLHYTSPDGEEGYPGNLSVDVTYTLQKDNGLRIDYKATTDKPTVLNLTNHAYFNLSGMKHDAMSHVLTINADHFLPTDNTQIPTGERRPVAGTVFDFRKPTVVGERVNDTAEEQIRFGNGYDHCWVFAEKPTSLRLGATLYEPESGRYMEMFTTEPAVQLYTGNHLNGKFQGREGVPFTRRYGLCLETQHFPDSPNKPDFPATTLRPGETYKTTTVYRFSAK